MADAPTPLDRDEQRLAELGYKQELPRGWSRFSNFAISFTIISVLAGCFTTYNQAWNFGGPIAISIGWPLICIILLTVAFSMSELASAYPTAGGPYWWAHRLGGKAWSWFTGWFNVVGLIAVVASVDYACAWFATTLFGLWGLDLGFVNFADAEHLLAETFWVFAVIVLLHAAINIYSSHLVALFNNISVFVHVIGVAIIIGILIIVPDTHQSFDFVFTERINNSGYLGGDTSGLFFWFLILPAGFLLTMYTVTGYDASAHVAEETRDAEMSAAKGIWQSVALAGLIGWFVLLAITFAVADPAAVTEGGSSSLVIFQTAMSEGWAEAVILISVVGQFFCGMACVTSCSRTFFAFSRDRATPGWKLWSRVNPRGVPVAAVLGSCLFAFILNIPALLVESEFVPPVAFFAVTSIAAVGLYIAYVAPVYLRWRAGSSFQPGAWTLGDRYKWMNIVAVVWVGLMVIAFCLPWFSTGVPWESDFDWSFFNFTPVTIGLTLLIPYLAWVFGMKDRYTGPIRQIEFDEAVGIKEIEEPEPPPAAAS